jgi:hypothetical protein
MKSTVMRTKKFITRIKRDSIIDSENLMNLWKLGSEEGDISFSTVDFFEVALR